MTAARQRLGREAEDLVAARVEAAGWRLIARNVRTAAVRGELDLIALERTTLVFVEVKARRAGSALGPETPAMAVGARKRAKLRQLAAAWLRECEAVPRHRELRFDVVGVRFGPGATVTEYEHLRGAF